MPRLCFPVIEWGRGVPAVLALVLLLGDLKLLAVLFAAALVHELGHLAAILLSGGRVECIRLELSGAEIRYSSRLSYRTELVVALCGPAFGALAAFIAAAFRGAELFCGASLLLSAVNLLPALPLDGGRIARALLWQHLEPEKAGLLCGVLTALSIGALAAAQIYMLLSGSFGGTPLTLICLIIIENFKDTPVSHDKKRA